MAKSKSERRKSRYERQKPVTERNRTKRKERHAKLHPNDKGIVNNPKAVCKWCCAQLQELVRKHNKTLLHFDLEQLQRRRRR